MVDLKLSAPRASLFRSVPHIAALSLVQRVVLLYVLSRIVTTVLFIVVGAHALPGSIPGPGVGLLDRLASWDGDWFRRISLDSYPRVLPEQDGAVAQNAWAFLPLYPLVVKIVTLGHITLWAPGAVVVSTVCGLVAALLLAELVRRSAGERPALAAAALFAFGPASYVLQTAYAESMGLMLLFLLLLLVDGHRYWAATATAIPLALTRPGMQAVTLFIGLHLLLRIRRARRHDEPFARREVVAVLSLGAVTAVLGLAWPIIAGLATGRRDAYLATELAWRSPYTGSSDLGFFTPWIVAFQGLFGGAGAMVLIAVLLVAASALLSPSVRRLGATVGLFSASWCLYLLAVFYPQSSTWRLLMPVAGLVGAVPLTTRPRLLIGILIAVALQAVLVWNAYGAVHGQYSPP